MNPDPVTALREATGEFRRRWPAGSPRAALEDFFDTAAGAVSRLRGQAGPASEAERAVIAAVEALIECGEAVFAADREAARTLGELLSAARHLAGILAPDPVRDARFDDLSRSWNWRTLG